MSEKRCETCAEWYETRVPGDYRYGVCGAGVSTRFFGGQGMVPATFGCIFHEKRQRTPMEQYRAWHKGHLADLKHEKEYDTNDMWEDGWIQGRLHENRIYLRKIEEIFGE